MRRSAVVISCLILGLGVSAFSQGGADGYPFDTPSDPRGLAMGGSSVAIPANPSALMYNPAGLAGLSGVHVSYAQRNLLPELPATLRSLNASVGTSFGVFAARYESDSYDLSDVRTFDGGSDNLNPHDYDIALGYALPLGRGFSIGAAAIYYDAGKDPSLIEIRYAPSTTPARLFDVGLMYTFRRFHSQMVVEDSLTIGMSYMNIGSNAGPYAVEYVPEGVPEYFLAGLSYALRVVPRNEGEPAPLQFVLAGAYRAFQSPGTGPGGIWGVGMECTFVEILTLRFGATPMYAFDMARSRFGLAFRLPVRNLGFDVSLGLAGVPGEALWAYSIEIQVPGLSL